MIKNRIIKLICLITASATVFAGAFAFAGCKEKPAPDPGEIVTPGDDTPDAKTHTVTFNTMGGSEIAAVKVEDGKNVNNPDTPTRADYTFTGWFKDEACTEEYDFTAAVTANITIYAGWRSNSEPAPATYEVKFDTKGGTAVKIQVVKAGGKAAYPENPEYLLRAFEGWFTDADCTAGKEYNFDTPVNANITLYAKWGENKYESYILTFDSKGGSSVMDIEVDWGHKTLEPPAPTKATYEFGGWYKDEACTQKFDFNTAVYESATLYAKWIPTAQTPTTEKKSYTYSYSAITGATADKQALTQANFVGANSFLIISEPNAVTWRNKALSTGQKAVDCIEIKGGVQIKFEGTGTLTVSFASTGSNNTSGLYLKDAQGNILSASTKTGVTEITSTQTIADGKVNEKGGYTVTGTKTQGTVTFTITEAGTYTLYCAYSYNDSTKGPQTRGSRIFSISMIDNVPLKEV